MLISVQKLSHSVGQIPSERQRWRGQEESERSADAKNQLEDLLSPISLLIIAPRPVEIMNLMSHDDEDNILAPYFHSVLSDQSRSRDVDQTTDSRSSRPPIQLDFVTIPISKGVFPSFL